MLNLLDQYQTAHHWWVVPCSTAAWPVSIFLAFFKTILYLLPVFVDFYSDNSREEV